MLRDDIEVVWMFKLEGRLVIVAWASKKLCYLLMLHDDMGVGVMWQEKLGQGNTPPSPSPLLLLTINERVCSRYNFTSFSVECSTITKVVQALEKNLHVAMGSLIWF